MSLPLIVLLSALTLPAGAAQVPRTYPLQGVQDNGRAFLTSRAILPLRCLDAPKILSLPPEEQAEILNKAATAGFNAVSFEAPLFGPDGLSKELGKVDEAQGANLTRLLEACEQRRLYAYPVLWTQTTADALIGTANAKKIFFGGKNTLGWQHWMSREMAKLKVSGRPITSTAVVGGWLLYRGPWPDGSPMRGAEPEIVTPSAEAWLRQWAQWQVRSYRKIGFRQKLGLGLWAKQDLPAVLNRQEEVEAPEGSPDAPVVDAAPFAPLAGPEVQIDTSLEHAKELDQLPPVPSLYEVQDDPAWDGDPNDERLAKEKAPTTPWDLEGLDWDKIEDFFATAPLSTQVDFLEFGLETEDWYRVGDRLAEAVLKAEVPVLWRQDWRTASRYERPKRLEPPEPIAGLLGPWPEEDWPGVGEAIWGAAKKDIKVPFEFRKLALVRKDRKVLLEIELNKPADIIVRWGKGWPLNQESRLKGREKAEASLPLGGIEPGQWILVQVKADTQRAGGAVARARWMRVPK